ncbi:hypothetical protein [Pseudomonas sp. FEN]|uniref:hypothetical protein n=1 Tax=Pseudomonas sp. FEN TaxID=2767468 RepID=UPI001748797F|nr:hypothetical protein [Pseudomonas sp. FEN]CAD5199605.1 hypothetical protein [Pseudomonas sp. FEN]
MGDVVSGRWDDKKGDASNTGGEEPPGDHPVEVRVAALEKVIPEIRERLARVETKLDNVERNMATKFDVEALRGSISTDVQKVVSDSTWRFVQISAVLAGLAFTAAKFIHP